jgi:hypothetical protein
VEGICHLRQINKWTKRSYDGATENTGSSPRTPNLSIQCRKDLISLTKALQTASSIVQKEAQRDLGNYTRIKQALAEGEPVGYGDRERKSYFNKGNLVLLDRALGLMLPTPNGDFTTLLSELANDSYLSI